MSRILKLSLYLCLLGAVACGQGETQRQEQASSEANQGVTGQTETGEAIVFAGSQSNTPTNTPAEAPEADGIEAPNQPDPEAGEFTLEEAVVGMPIDGSLVVEVGTDFGAFFCDLYADRAPNTVANFIGLVRGLRPFWDPNAGEWVRRPFYRGQVFHRVIPDFLIQTGDFLNNGESGVGYTIDDEMHDSLSHDQAGQLCMANADGPNSAGGQFFITDGPSPQLDADGGSTIFGQCRPAHVIGQIARVPQNPENDHRPLTPVRMNRILIRRVEGGAASATPTLPVLPPGEPEVPRGASPGPSELRSRSGRRFPEPSPLPRRRGGEGRRLGPNRPGF